MWDLAVREEDFNAAETMVQRYPKAPLSFRIPPAYARHDTAAFDRLREEVRKLPARQAQIAGRYLATYLEDFAAGEELARMDLAPDRSAASRLSAQTFLAWLEVGRGRWTSANTAFDSAAHMDGGQVVLTDRAIAATLPFLEVPRSDVEAIRRALESWDPASEELSGVSSLGRTLRPYLRLYLLGLLSARLGDDERALRHAQELERLPPLEQSRSVVRGLVAMVRADVAQRRERHAEVLTALQPANGEVPLELVYVRPFVNVREYTQEHARYLRIEALLALGRSQEARNWLETSFQGSQSEMVYLAPVHERLATIHARRGDRKGSAAHYRAFVTLWRDSDAALQARVKQAQAELTRLESR